MAKIWIYIGVVVLAFVIFRATQILLDYQNFRRNEKVIAELVAEILKLTEPSEVKKDKYCQEIHQKYSEGPKSCYIYQALYYPTTDQNEMLVLVERIKDAIKETDTTLIAEGDETRRLESDSKQYYSFNRNNQQCGVSFYYHTDETERLLYESGSKEGKLFRGLVANIDCGQGVKWAYYPLD